MTLIATITVVTNLGMTLLKIERGGGEGGSEG